MKILTLRRPDDWHVHLRDGAMLGAVARYTAQQFARAIIMPNLAKPVTTVQAAEAYRARILDALGNPSDFTPLMTLYLTDNIKAGEIQAGFERAVLTACKLYPAGATTNSSHGVTDLTAIYPALELMQSIGMPLLVHGEVTDAQVDIFDREAVFIERVLIPLTYDFPELKIVFEHITTQQAAEFVMEAGPNIAATITPHHLEFNRNAIFLGGIRPHYYCLPIAKREVHRQALRRAATSGSPKFFLGTDSAPHRIEAKQSACGCAGLFNAPCALQSYVQTFAQEGALDKFENFASVFGAQFYGLPLNDGTITLTAAPAQIPETVKVEDSSIVPFHGGETMAWSIKAS